MPGGILKKLPLLSEQGLFSGAAFLVNIVLVKALPLEQYGIFATLVILSHLLLSISQSLIVQPMQVNIGKAVAPFGYRLTLLSLQGLLVFACLAVLGLVYLADFSFLVNGRSYFLPFCGYLSAFLSFDFFRKYFLATGRIKTTLVLTSVYVATSAVLLLVAIASQFVTSLAGFLYLLMAGHLPALTLAIARYCQGLTVPTRPALRSFLSTHLLEGQWLLYAAIVQWLSSNMYVMASGLLINIEALGVLRFVQSLLGLVNILLQTIENYVVPQLSSAYQASLQHCYRAFPKAMLPYQAAILTGLAILFVFAGPVLQFTGNANFLPYTFVLRGMVLLYAIIILAYPIRLLIRITELNKSYFSAYLISFLISILSYRFLLNQFGVSGAILGLVLNQLVLQVTWLIVLNKNQFNAWRLYTS